MIKPPRLEEKLELIKESLENNSDITIMPLEAEIRTDNNYLFIYSANRQKWGRIAIDKSNW